ncbi:DUF6387 family protein [Colwellia sp. 6_MG-2023]|uniref:DUF6387 family protein n=1 Tax=Colwellia sp. 6_MG-2023 TaxID=3062676 RepID=UPI0026E3B541|nr:DUF6387 family protein [Colwellia sp. 6_MG-2023]MDO6488671.1 DUF6387 family protein [Colwellia sp. 6_MG-2023]
MSFLKELPEWFDLDNYQVLTDLTPRELKAQFDERIMIHSSVVSIAKDKTSTPLHFDILNDGICKIKKIWAGEPVINGLSDNERFEHKPVTPTSSEDAVNHYLALQEKGFFEGERWAYEDNRQYFVNNDLYTENRKLEPDEDAIYTQGFSINIDLEFSTNKEILDIISTSLNKWRAKTRLNEPSKGQLVNDTYKSKILQYKVLPLIDLFIWQTIHSKKMSRKVIFDVVYKDFFRTNRKGELVPICDDYYDERIKAFILKCIGKEKLEHNPEIFNIFKLPFLNPIK